MKIVIKIDEYDKEWIHNAWDIPNEIKSKVVDAIENGTPLPEHHGRLIDADAIKYTHTIARSLDDGHNWNELCVTKDELYNAPTIIDGSEDDAT